MSETPQATRQESPAPDHPQTPGDEPPIFVSVAEAANMIGLSRTRMYGLLDEQLIESRYLGARRLVVRDSVVAFAEALPDKRSCRA